MRRVDAPQDGSGVKTGRPSKYIVVPRVGLDTLDKIGRIMYGEYHEKRYASPPLLKRMIALGMFGRKSGKGFYDYSGDEPKPVDLGT
jgi:3-hydroxyacyl-CoA dehydrogenase